MRIVIIGSGVAGSVLADMLSQWNHHVLILEKEGRPGGMCKSYRKDGFIYEYGPHILAIHNSSEHVASYIQSKIETIPTQVTSASVVNDTITYYPPSVHSADRLGIGDTVRAELAALPPSPDESNFESYLKDRVGSTLYQLFFYEFTKKFWGVEPSTLSAEWAKIRHLGERLDTKRMFFNDKWCSYPKSDWNALFSSLLERKQVLYSVEVVAIDFESQKVLAKGSDEFTYDLLISTMHIDQLFAFAHGKLDYAGYRIEPVVLLGKHHAVLDGSPISMTYYPGLEHDFCRVTDYGSFQRKSSPPFSNGTILTYEYPDSTHRLYPFSDSRNVSLFEQYLVDASKQSRLITFGRMGLYKYLTTDTTVEMALRLMPLVEGWTIATPEQRMDFYRTIRGDWDN